MAMNTIDKIMTPDGTLYGFIPEMARKAVVLGSDLVVQGQAQALGLDLDSGTWLLMAQASYTKEVIIADASDDMMFITVDGTVVAGSLFSAQPSEYGNCHAQCIASVGTKGAKVLLMFKSDAQCTVLAAKDIDKTTTLGNITSLIAVRLGDYVAT